MNMIFSWYWILFVVPRVVAALLASILLEIQNPGTVRNPWESGINRTNLVAIYGCVKVETLPCTSRKRCFQPALNSSILEGFILAWSESEKKKCRDEKVSGRPSVRFLFQIRLILWVSRMWGRKTLGGAFHLFGQGLVHRFRRYGTVNRYCNSGL